MKTIVNAPFLFAVILALSLQSSSAHACPKIFRTLLPFAYRAVCPKPPKDTFTPLPTPTRPPPIFRPRPPFRPPIRRRGDFEIEVTHLEIIKGHDGFLRRCVDPRLYMFYVSATFGRKSSARGVNLGHINYGSGRCSGTVLRKGGARLKRNSGAGMYVGVYVIIGLERDVIGNKEARKKVRKELRKATKKIKKLAKKNYSRGNIEKLLNDPDALEKFLEPFLKGVNKSKSEKWGHDLVGANGLIVIGGTKLKSQPKGCLERPNFPVCVILPHTKRLRLAGARNRWEAGVRLWDFSH